MGGDGKELGGGGEGGSRGNDPNGNDRDRVFKSPEVSTRPRVISKPEPQYTEQARREQQPGDGQFQLGDRHGLEHSFRQDEDLGGDDRRFAGGRRKRARER